MVEEEEEEYMKIGNEKLETTHVSSHHCVVVTRPPNTGRGSDVE